MKRFLFVFLLLPILLTGQQTAFILEDGGVAIGEVTERTDAGVLLTLDSGNQLFLEAGSIRRESKRWRNLQFTQHNAATRVRGWYGSVDLGVNLIVHETGRRLFRREFLPMATASVGKQFNDFSVGIGTAWFVANGWGMPLYAEGWYAPFDSQVRPMLRLRSGIFLPGEPKYEQNGLYGNFGLGCRISTPRGIDVYPMVSYTYLRQAVADGFHPFASEELLYVRKHHMLEFGLGVKF